MNRTVLVLLACGLAASGAARAAALYPSANGDTGPTITHVQYYEPYQERRFERSAVIEERERRINFRIQRGLSDGSITPWEARRLYRELGIVRHKERAFESDGWIDRREFGELSADLDRVSEHVRAEKWDGERLYGYR